MRIARHIIELDPYVHGEQPQGKNVIKLNTNENAYPPSPKCRKALAKFDVADLRRYPQAECVPLRKAIAKSLHAEIENIFVGNGSDEILSLCAKCFVEDDEAIASLDPSYSLYKTLAAIRNVPWLGFDRPEDSLSAKRKLALFLLANPNAPTGTFTPLKRISAFAKKFRGVVLVDEAYVDFSKTNAMKLALSPKNDNLIVMRTFSKSYSLAGLRVGYCVGPKTLIDALYKIKDSYNVDAIAQAVALAAFEDRAWMQKNALKIVKSRAWLTGELAKRGWKVLPSEANFIFAKPPRNNAKKLFDALHKREIYLRHFAASPKTRDYLRITVGTDDQLKKLLKALDELDLRQ